MKKASNDSLVDVVIPWVDCNDARWIKERAKYSNCCNNSEGNNDARFRDWNTLKYVFRSLYEYAPWINRIYLVTSGQIPDWLNIDNSKIKVIDHKDFIPDAYLPTFCANAIELNLHRIKGLSEQFIFLNDDIILINKTSKKQFFKKGLPCDTAVLNTHCGWKSRLIYNIAFNDTAIINEHYKFKEVISNSKKNWFNYKYGIKNNLQNLILLNCPRFPGFKQFHMANSFLKSSYEYLWDLETEEFTNTCMDKFRNKNHINQWLIREYQLVSNNFIPTKKYKMGIMIDFEKDGEEKAIKKCEKYLFNSKYKMMCINDGDSIKNYLLLKNKINELLEKKFPNKTPYEK